MANNRICLVCGKAYEYCEHCSGNKSPIWMNLYHDNNCRQIFHAVSDYNQKVITKEEGRERLSECDLNIELKDNFKKYVDEIMFVKKQDSKEKSIQSNTVAGVDSTAEEKPVRRTGKKKNDGN